MLKKSHNRQWNEIHSKWIWQRDQETEELSKFLSKHEVYLTGTWPMATGRATRFFCRAFRMEGTAAESYVHVMITEGSNQVMQETYDLCFICF